MAKVQQAAAIKVYLRWTETWGTAPQLTDLQQFYLFEFASFVHFGGLERWGYGCICSMDEYIVMVKFESG